MFFLNQSEFSLLIAMCRIIPLEHSRTYTTSESQSSDYFIINGCVFSFWLRLFLVLSLVSLMIAEEAENSDGLRKNILSQYEVQRHFSH